jgi:hypothetical protein
LLRAKRETGTKPGMTCLEVFCVWLKFLCFSLQLIRLRRLKRLGFICLRVADGLSFDSKRLKRWCFTIYIYSGSHVGLLGSYGSCWPSRLTRFFRVKSLAGFFLNPARFQPRVIRATGRPAGSSFKTMPKMVLSTKLLLLIDHNKMMLWNVRTKH